MPERTNTRHPLWLVVALTVLTTSCATEPQFSTRLPLRVGSVSQVTVQGENLKPVILARPTGGACLAWARRDGEKTGIYFAVSQDGVTYGKPVRISPEAMDLDLGAESGPQAAVGPDGAIHVVWTAGSWKVPPVSSQAPKNGAPHDHKGHKGAPPRPDNLNIYLVSSRDGGEGFSPPIKINDEADGAEHRFPTVAVDARGVVSVVWLDKRKQTEERPDFSRVYFARSTDGGKSFSPNVDATQGQDHGICHCCKLALAVDARAGIFIAYRNDVSNVRDIYLLRSRDDGTSFGKPAAMEDIQWMIPGCPMSGPSLAFDKANRLHAVWRTSGNVAGTPTIGSTSEEGTKVLYRRFDSQKQSWSELLFLAAGSHPRLTVDAAGTVYVAWKQDGLHLAMVPPSGTGSVQSVPLSAAGAAANFPSLATTSNGVLLAAWQQPDTQNRSQIFVTTVASHPPMTETRVAHDAPHR